MQASIQELDKSSIIISHFVQALLTCFRFETRYERPLLPPQNNTVLVLDKEVAEQLNGFMTDTLQQRMGFDSHEFRLVTKVPQEGQGLHRVRLEFCNGVNLLLLQRLQQIIENVEKHYPISSPLTS